jgi:alkaline phosphatase
MSEFHVGKALHGLITVGFVKLVDRTATATLLAALIPGVAVAQAVPTRVILFVADGAGAGHWGLATSVMDHLAVADFPVSGLVDTRGADHVVTESAAGATALATGVRTFYGALSVGPDSLPRESVLEAARARGLGTGLVTTTSFLDATPAAFVAHVPSRRALARIFEGYLANRPTVVLAGGRRALARRLPPDSTPVGDRFRQAYTVVTTADELAAVGLDTVTALLGLLADGDLPLAPDRSPSLAQLAETALTVLDRNPLGFFLLVENEETDTQAHGNAPLPILAAEMRAFDEAVRAGVRYQDRHPETLIVVVADHETGGLSLTHARDSLQLSYHTKDHTAELVPLFARGPGAERFSGLLTNAEVGQRLMAAVRAAGRR